MAENQSNEQEISRGKDRAMARFNTLKEWQANFYEQTPMPEVSRQYKRWLSRMVAKKEAAYQKHQSIWNRSTVAKEIEGSNCAEIECGE
jgi:hypothetical protein